MSHLEDIIEGCKRGEQTAAKLLYEMYAPQMRAICYRYTGNLADAEDVMHDAFIRILTRIGQYRGDGSFEGWMKRVFIHTSLDFIRHKKTQSLVFPEDVILEKTKNKTNEPATEDTHDNYLPDVDISQEALMMILQTLPDGYRMVFNLYVMEDLSHKEIADLLKISVNTSKTQLSKARKNLRTKIMDYVRLTEQKNKDEQYRSFLKIVI
jgi:RNA polymerase sigma factor (sigma-70 family)